LLSALVLDEAMKAVKVKPILFADDGVLLGREDELKKMDGNILGNYGVILSDKLKKDGRPATGETQDVLNFLGMS